MPKPFTLLAAGAPGTGKSSFLASVGAIGPAKLFAIKANEVNSYLYEKYGIAEHAETFENTNWRPSQKQYVADGYTRLMQRLWEFHDKDTEFDFLLIDPLTDVSDLMLQFVMAKEKIAAPGESKDSRGIYGELRPHWKEFASVIRAMTTAKRPKYVLAAVHTQPATEQEVTEGKGIRFEGNVLPALTGGIRTMIAGEFDVVVFTDVRHVFNQQARSTDALWEIQVVPDAERHAKSRLGQLAAKRLPNNFQAFLDAVNATKKVAA